MELDELKCLDLVPYIYGNRALQNMFLFRRKCVNGLSCRFLLFLYFLLFCFLYVYVFSSLPSCEKTHSVLICGNHVHIGCLRISCIPPSIVKTDKWKVFNIKSGLLWENSVSTSSWKLQSWHYLVFLVLNRT